jgi:hypothetical protein
MIRILPWHLGQVNGSSPIQDNYNITVPQLECLREISDNEPISLGGLTRLLHLDNSTVTGIVDRMDPTEVDKILQAIDKLADMLQVASAAEQEKTPSGKK